MPKIRVPRHEVVQPQDQRYKLIPLTQGQTTIVDAADYNWLNQFNWYASWNPNTKSFYAKRRQRVGQYRHLFQMAVEILKCNPQEQPDHRNRNTLDNRRENLRKATRSQNSSNRKTPSTNTSGYKGVYFIKETGKWGAYICHEGIEENLGIFTSTEKAARARDKAAKRLHGEFAVLNFQ